MLEPRKAEGFDFNAERDARYEDKRDARYEDKRDIRDKRSFERIEEIGFDNTRQGDR